MFEDAEDGDGVGGRDEGAEEEAMDEGDVEGEGLEEVVRGEADDGGGDEDSDGGHEEDDEFLIGEVVEIDVKGAGEEEEAEHAFHEDFVEIDTGDDFGGGGGDEAAGGAE